MRSRNPRYKKIPYGGYAITPNSSSKRPPKNMSTTLVDFKKLAGKDVTATTALSRATYIANVINDLSTTPAGKIILSLVSNGITSALNPSKTNLPAFSQNSLIRSKIGTDETRTYITRFHVGMKSTRSVIEAEKQHGSVNLQIADSLTDSLDTPSRMFLKRTFGFNSKSFDFLNESFYPVISDYEKLYNLRSWNIPEHSLQVPYGLVKSEYSNIKIRNSNTYHRILIKLHVVKVLDDDKTLHSLYKNCFSDKSKKQKVGAIPIVYQVLAENDDPIIKNRFMNSCIVHNGASLNMAASFKSQAKIVSTFSQYLNPGDTFDFRMTHHCGPGLRFDLAREYLDNVGDGLQPSGYGIIIEALGTNCEAIRFSDGSIFQGTSPGWYNFEYKKGITLVRNSTVISKSSDLESTLEKKYAVKVHEREFLKEEPLYIPPHLIGAPGEEGKEYAVVSVSSEQTVYSKPDTAPNPSQSNDIPTTTNNNIELENFDNYGSEEEEI